LYKGVSGHVEIYLRAVWT